MFDNFTLYLLLLAALGIGFLLGRRKRDGAAAPRRHPAERYFAGFNQLVDEQRDLDLDSFVESLVPDDEGVETRLVLGSLVRRRGEVDKAIRMHQTLLARPTLSPAERSRIELELARDYMAAGLLGRAENLLLELAGRNGPERDTARRALLEIYQREREWRQAVEIGVQIARDDRTVNARLAHFQCELAGEALARGDLPLARRELERGAEFEAGCARISLVGAELELAAGRHDAARSLLRRAVGQDPDCVPLAVGPYRAASEALDDHAGYVAFLQRCLADGAFLPVVRELADHLEKTAGSGAASDFVIEQLMRNPTLGGFVALLEHLDRDGMPLDREQLALVRQFSQSLLDRQAAYRCRNCGFSSHGLMWQCPSCHEWGSAKPIVGRTLDP